MNDSPNTAAKSQHRGARSFLKLVKLNASSLHDQEASMRIADHDSLSLETTINLRFLLPEAEAVEGLWPFVGARDELSESIRSTAQALVTDVRVAHNDVGGLQAFLKHYDLSSNEGVVLMCLAEALLRIPDDSTLDAFIADKLSNADWRQHLGESESLFVNASTWALMLSGSLLNYERNVAGSAQELLGKVLTRLEEPVLRAALKTAMKIMAAEFVMGKTIGEALTRAQSDGSAHYRFSYDMLGEAALTEADAEQYLHAYLDAISTLGKAQQSIAADRRSSISVKLSALYPRFEPMRSVQAVERISEHLLTLVGAAQANGVGLTVDAEEADRLVMSVQIFTNVYMAIADQPHAGFGIAVQAYQKRALEVLRYINKLSRDAKRSISVRLVKGAYWDTEIKRAQEQGLVEFPVYTFKRHTDLSYLACAQYIFSECPYIYGQFATHNAQTLSFVQHHARGREYEFQRLHGMGEDLYDALARKPGVRIPCRVYAPVGAHEDLLPYLVRRLLENGANTSFVNRIAQHDIPIDRLTVDPRELVGATAIIQRNPAVTLSCDIYQPYRLNSSAINFADPSAVRRLQVALEQAREQPRSATPFIGGEALTGRKRSVINPSRIKEAIGEVYDADTASAAKALDVASAGFVGWQCVAADKRATTLERAADLIDAYREELIALCVLEAGKTLRDAADELREAIDFLRYYATQCRLNFTDDVVLPGPTGELNKLRWRGRGVFVCISPWNFPVAIFLGQIAAALAAGNTVIAKPAEQTSLIAWRCCEILFEAGLPKSALSFLPGDGAILGQHLLSDALVAGVAFTGSTPTARSINRTLAARDAPLPVIIAETGGINVMLADSSALPEHVVRDAVLSAFNSAGQRCSALRLLCLQEEIAPRVLELLAGFMDTWITDDPTNIESDTGPVIDAEARDHLESTIRQSEDEFTLLYRGRASSEHEQGYFVAPAIVEVRRLDDLRNEVFGPVLHVVRYRAENFHRLLDEINALGYGLTLGLQSRIEQRIDEVRDRVQVGNVYVNRNMIGATVGSQPFGGTANSGTGPKAGGSNYLLRFAVEQTLTINTSAIGGNAELFSD
jgi:RHH-type proline utilization regulon transcriptional repressor/proline dehydrogenase/delta 1-pyrroline-5-carboxylate dehydrogenase